jgi:hypothetical protein
MPLSKFLSKILPLFCMYVVKNREKKNHWLSEANNVFIPTQIAVTGNF